MAELNQRTDAILRRLVRRDAKSGLRKVIARTRPEDLAAAMEHLTWSEQKRLFAMIEDAAYAAMVLTNMSDERTRELAASLSVERVADLLEEMDPDDAADLVSLLPVELRMHVMKELGDTDEATEMRKLLEWPRDSAGGIMAPHMFRIRDDATCGAAIDALQQHHEELETVFYVYVVDAEARLVGVASLRSLLTHPPATPIRQVMEKDLITVAPTQDQEDVARFVARYDLLAVPVVDEERRLLGIVTVDDVVDVIREEAAEDMMRMAGVQEGVDPMSRSVVHQASHRAGWLAATALGGVAMAEILGAYRSALEGVVILAAFIPVIMGMGGNVGIQTATVAVRGLAMGHVQLGGAVAFVWREARVGILLGLLYGMILGLYAAGRFDASPMFGISVAASVGLAVVGASVIGACVPVLLEKSGADPAIATGPFVTTSVDIVGVLIYFNVARLLIGL